MVRLNGTAYRKIQAWSADHCFFTAGKRCKTDVPLLGSITVSVKPVKSIDEMVKKADSMLIDLRYVKKEDRVVIVAGHPLSLSGKTNFMKMHIVGEEF